MPRSLISVSFFRPGNFQNQSSCVVQNGNKYYLGMLKNSESEPSETAIFSLNFTSGITERVFPDLLERAGQVLNRNSENLKGLTTEHSGARVLNCVGNKLFFEMTLGKRPAGFTGEHRTHIILDLDLDISQTKKSLLSK